MSAATERFEHPISERIRKIALRLPEATEGKSCVNRAFQAAGKNFAFLGERDGGVGLRLKLGESVDDVTERATAEPDHYEVGTHGWTMLRIDTHDHPPVDDLERWITESYRLLAPKRLAAMLD